MGVTMNKTSNSVKFKGIILTLTGGCFWGLSGSCGQYLFQYKGVTAQWLVPIRLVLAGIFSLIILYSRQKTNIFSIWKNKSHSIQIVIFAVFGMMLCQYSYFAAIQKSNAGTATVLQYLGPAMILVYMCIKNKVPPKKNEIIAIMFALLGTFLLATHGNLNNLSISPSALFWGLLAALFLAVYTIQPAELLSYYDTTMVIGWGMLIGGLLLIVAFRPWNMDIIVDWQVVVTMIVIILFGTILSFTFYLEGVKYVGPTKASLYACIEPVSATIISILWLKVAFSWIDIIGFIFIISTIFILSINNSSSTSSSESL